VYTSILANAASDQPASGGGLLSLLPLLLIFVAMYFLLLRPQRKRQKEARALQDSLKEGDEVLLNSGIIGFVDEVQDDGIVWLNVADKVEIRVTKGAIASRMSSVESRGQQAG
jgi:preprotein translocase subunit YajC